MFAFDSRAVARSIGRRRWSKPAKGMQRVCGSFRRPKWTTI